MIQQLINSYCAVRKNPGVPEGFFCFAFWAIRGPCTICLRSYLFSAALDEKIMNMKFEGNVMFFLTVVV